MDENRPIFFIYFHCKIKNFSAKILIETKETNDKNPVFLFEINCKVLYMFIINNNSCVVKFKKYLFFFHDDVGLSCV